MDVTITPEFQLEFEIKLTGTHSSWTNVMEFTAKGAGSGHGRRIPGIFIIPSETNPSVPDSLIYVGSCLHQIGVFRVLTRDYARLRHRGMSWIAPKGPAVVFLSLMKAGTSVISQVLPPFKK